MIPGFCYEKFYILRCKKKHLFKFTSILFFPRVLPQVPASRPVPSRLQVRRGGGELPAGGSDLRGADGDDRSSEGERPGCGEEVQDGRHQGGLDRNKIK